MAASAANIITHLRMKYPHPEPDPTWVSACIAALSEDGQAATPASVETQYIYSDLGASTRHSRGAGVPIPQNDEDTQHHHLHGRTLFHTPTLLQVHSVSEVGASAFTLLSTRDARKDILSGATQIRRLGDEEEDDATQAPTAGAGEKPPPPYPRAMLAMDVSDGRTALRAIEYRRMQGLVLGETPLGIKLLVHNARCLRGTRGFKPPTKANPSVLLTPENCTLVGGAIDALESEQPAAFIASLENRLEAAQNGTAGGTLPAPTRRRTLPTTRRAGTATHAPAAPPARAAASSSDAARAARRAAIQAAIALPPSPATIDLTADTTVDDFEDSFDFDFDDDVIEHIEAAEAAAHSQLSRFATQPGRPRPRTAAPRRRGEPEIIEISD